MEHPPESTAGMGFLLLKLQETQTVDMSPLPISICTEKLNFIRLKHHSDTHHPLILFTTGFIFPCQRYLFTKQAFMLGTSNCCFKWCLSFQNWHIACTLPTCWQKVGNTWFNTAVLLQKVSTTLQPFISDLSIKNIHSTRQVNMPWKNACFWQAFRTWCYIILYYYYFNSLFL